MLQTKKFPSKLSPARDGNINIILTVSTSKTIGISKFKKYLKQQNSESFTIFIQITRYSPGSPLWRPNDTEGTSER